MLYKINGTNKLFDSATIVLRERTEDIKLETSRCEQCRKSDYRNIGTYTCVTCGKDNRNA